jgi:hypothetical protein
MLATSTRALHSDSSSGRSSKVGTRKTFDLAMASQKNQQLEAQIEASRTVRRKKVQIDPNEAFADIEAIRRA